MKMTLCFLWVLFSAASLLAIPAQVVIIRHAEKPPEGNELSIRGFQRADALPNLFRNNPTISAFGWPVAIYAMNPKSPNGSLRAIETVTPLSRLLNQGLHVAYTREQIKPLVQEIMRTPNYDGHTVLICWEHNMIPQLAAAFGALQAPSDWPSNVFDRAWVLRFSASGLLFSNLPQRLLPGDSPD